MTSPYQQSGTPPSNSGQQPEQDKPKKPLWKRWWVWLIAVVLVALVAFSVSVFYEVNKVNNLDAEAAEQCREKVLEQAKYPGGVQFVDEPVVTEDGITVNDRGNDVLSMGGEVDFPNAFGTPTRGTYLCLTEVEGYEILKTKAIVTGFNK